MTRIPRMPGETAREQLDRHTTHPTTMRIDAVALVMLREAGQGVGATLTGLEIAPWPPGWWQTTRANRAMPTSFDVVPHLDGHALVHGTRKLACGATMFATSARMGTEVDEVEMHPPKVMIVDVDLPETTRAAAVGRALRDVVDHPDLAAIAHLTVLSVECRLNPGQEKPATYVSLDPAWTTYRVDATGAWREDEEPAAAAA